MLSRDPAYSVNSLGTETTMIMMQFTYATTSELAEARDQKQEKRQHSLPQETMTLLDNHLEQISLSSAAIAELP